MHILLTVGAKRKIIALRLLFLHRVLAHQLQAIPLPHQLLLPQEPTRIYLYKIKLLEQGLPINGIALQMELPILQWLDKQPLRIQQRLPLIHGITAM